MNGGSEEPHDGLLRSTGPTSPIDCSTSSQTPFYQFFYGQDTPPTLPDYRNGQKDWSTRREGRKYMAKLMHALASMTNRDRELLMDTAAHMASCSQRNGP